jgi:LexA-binding, inner membrane-associated putative hydrolase
MTLTPLHAAFVWILKPWFFTLSFAALTIGSFVPDIEPLITFATGWSAFCGWDFPCSIAPDRLVLHSIFGALTIDTIITMGIVRLLSIAKLDRIGIHGFTNVKVSSPGFYLSAAIGSLTHVFLDWLHHPANPVFWPMSINGSYYVGGLLLPYFSVFEASLVIAILSVVLLTATSVWAISKAGKNPWILITNPPAALSVVTGYLSGNEQAV